MAAPAAPGEEQHRALAAGHPGQPTLAARPADHCAKPQGGPIGDISRRARSPGKGIAPYATHRLRWQRHFMRGLRVLLGGWLVLMAGGAAAQEATPPAAEGAAADEEPTDDEAAAEAATKVGCLDDLSAEGGRRKGVQKRDFLKRMQVEVCGAGRLLRLRPALLHLHRGRGGGLFPQRGPRAGAAGQLRAGEVPAGGALHLLRADPPLRARLGAAGGGGAAVFARSTPSSS